MSFSLAAEELNVSQSAVSLQIKALEDYLGVELLLRQPRALKLTDEGEGYSATLHETFQRIFRATDDLRHKRAPAKLSINTLPTFAIKWLVPRLTQFNAANPKIEVRMITSVKPVDLQKEDIDIAIRIAPSSIETKANSQIDLVMTNDWARIRSIPFLTEKLLVVCAPSLLRNAPPIRQPGDLRHQRLLHTRRRAWLHWFESMGMDDFLVEGTAVHGHFFLAIQAAVEGKGVALIPRILVESELKAGSLVALFDQTEVTGGCYHLMCLEDNWNIAKVKSFRNWLVDEVKAA